MVMNGDANYMQPFGMKRRTSTRIRDCFQSLLLTLSEFKQIN